MLFLVLLAIIGFGCNKALDIKPTKSLVIPSTLKDVQALLDNHNILNEKGLDLLELITDNYYATTEDLLTCPKNDQDNYLWAPDATNQNGWQLAYQFPVYYSNAALDALNGLSINNAEQEHFNALKGAALFYRSFAFFQLAQLYCLPYSLTANTDAGIVLRLDGDINVVSKRASVEQTYHQITEDLLAASNLLPVANEYLTRPTKTAAFGLLARVYLSMRKYDKAGQYADSCLMGMSTLMNFNDLVPVGNPPIVRFNEETIFYNRPMALSWVLYPPFARIDTVLYNMYAGDDLRKEVFFYTQNDAIFFRGCYDGNYWESVVFDGIATDEQYLILAECKARAGSLNDAANALNTLLEHRWRTGRYTPYVFTTKENALTTILDERRKELVFRGQRWTDLRRLNVEGAAITLHRNINGTTYSLPPGDPRWVLLIPDEVINRSGILQNER